MKHLTAILLLFLIFNHTLYSQNVDGFGQIKLGKTYSQIIADLSIEEKKIKTESKNEKLDFMEVYMPRKVILLQYDSTMKKSEIDYMYVKCMKAKLLILPEYKISDLKVEQIELRFLDDILYSIKVNSPSLDFKEAIETKYGKGHLEKTEKTVTCTSAYAPNGFEEKESTYTTTWDNDNPDIKTTSILMDYRDSKCKQTYLSYFSIEDNSKSKIVRNCEIDTRSAIERKKEQELKSKLKDF